jgi:hypothetical protein
MITIKQIFNNLPSSVEELCIIVTRATTRPEKEEAGSKEERNQSKRKRERERERERDNKKNPERVKKPAGDHDVKEQKNQQDQPYRQPEPGYLVSIS